LFWPFRVLLTTVWIGHDARDVDVVYVNGLGVESALGAWWAGKPMVCKVVGDYAWERAVGLGVFSGTMEEYQKRDGHWFFKVLNFVRNWPLRRAVRVVVPSEYLRAMVCSWGMEEERVEVVLNAAPVAHGMPRVARIAGDPWEGRTLVTVCRLVPWKGVDGLIAMLSELPGTRVVVVGDGPERGALVELAGRLGVAGRVCFVGEVSRRAVPAYLRAADAFVLNSSYEGLPHVVLEAMEVGVPVVATDAGGAGELVVHERTGLLVPVGDGGALLEAVRRLWDAPGLAVQLVEAARLELGRRFSHEGMVGATERILAETVQGGEGEGEVTEVGRAQ